MVLLANAPKYPLGVKSPGNDLCISGGKVQGQQARTLTWSQMKSKWDGDAVFLGGVNGQVTPDP